MKLDQKNGEVNLDFFFSFLFTATWYFWTSYGNIIILPIYPKTSPVTHTFP